MKRQIDLVLDHVRRPVRQPKVEFELRMPSGEVQEHRAEFLVAGILGRGDPERPAQGSGAVAQGVAGGGNLGHGRAAAIGEAPAVVRQSERTRAALEQLDAQAPFEGGDATAEGANRRTAFPRGGYEAARPRHGQEGADLVEAEFRRVRHGRSFTS